MTVVINKSKAVGTVKIPPSKSVAHRALICAAFTDGVSRIENLPICDDIAATVDCLTAFGVKLTVSGSTATVYGKNPQYYADKKTKITLDCRESASTLRFLFPFCLVTGIETEFIGSKRLFERPLSVYEKICKEQNIKLKKNVGGVTVCGKLSSNVFEIDGNISSQFASGLMMALPHVDCGNIILTSPLESAPYLSLTEKVMKDFGYTVKSSGNEFSVSGIGTANENFSVPSDMSSAAFFGALNTLGGKVEFSDYREDAFQGDFVFSKLFDKLSSGFAEISVKDTPDLFPILAVVAACFDGARFYDVGRLRLKESDRLAAMDEELAKCGVAFEYGDNCVTVSGKPKAPNAPLFSHNDHRIAMALAILLTTVGGTLDGAECVSKSFPDFFAELAKVGIDLRG